MDGKGIMMTAPTKQPAIDIDALRRGLVEEDDFISYDIADIMGATFEKIGGPHDWRVYVPKICRRHWRELSEETRLVIYMMSESQSNEEIWE